MSRNTKDGKYTQKELNYLIGRLRDLEAQNRTDASARQEMENLRYEIKWAREHLE
ncbi:MAG: hypothetical protein MR966_01275 [Lachnospiraceae bacterium]|nr:hypothetical protein [Lachnospiraceae bacterium]